MLRPSLKSTDLSSLNQILSTFASEETTVICLAKCCLIKIATPPACLPRLLRAFGLEVDHCTKSGRSGRLLSI